MIDVLIRGVRAIDPLDGLDLRRADLLIREGRLVGVERGIEPPDGVTVVDLGRRDGAEAVVACPGFIDLHAHLREPGGEAAETVRSGAEAAAAGGFAQVVAMANTTPSVDTPARIGQARGRSASLLIRVHPAAAVTRGVRGERLVDIPACAAAGAVAFSDDGRNAASPRLLRLALETAAAAGRVVLVHPEDEAMVLAANPGADPAGVARCPQRPAACETSAVERALEALEGARDGRLHLQHLSASAALAALRHGRERGLAVSAEATPHHLAMWLPLEVEPEPASLRKVNPPLRTEADRVAVVQALREGFIDAVATDHAPHTATDKGRDYAAAAPGIGGLETALASCITLGAMGGDWLPVLVERLTAGPWRVLGPDCGVAAPRLRVGERATITLFDPLAEWVVGEARSASLSRNTPLGGVPLRGRVELTVVEGSVAFCRAGSPLSASVQPPSDGDGGRLGGRGADPLTAAAGAAAGGDHA